MTDAKQVHDTLARHQLADGLPVVFDLERSHGSWLVDGRTGDEHLDFFTNFASWPIGHNHPRMAQADYREELLQAALVNPANSDLYTVPMARFVEAFATRVTPAGFDHHFWVAGGALAVENAMKVAFDWKAQKNGRTSFADDGEELVILHFRGAFHGRSGYTLSVTNTGPGEDRLVPEVRLAAGAQPGHRVRPRGLRRERHRGRGAEAAPGVRSTAPSRSSRAALRAS